MKRKIIDTGKYLLKRMGVEIRLANPRLPTAQASNVLALTISDLYLRRLLNGQTDPDLTFVQIGANDGLSYDPIRRFILKYRLRGVFVEPQPEAFARLRRNYETVQNVAFENAAIAAKNGHTKMYRFRKGPGVPEWADCLTSFSDTTLRKNFHNVKGEIEAIDVPTLTFGSLLQKHQLDRVDLLQIDTEGFDYELLKLIDFTAVRPAIIQFEHGFLSFHEQRECFGYLHAQGYRVTNNGPDTVAYLEPEEQALFDIHVQAQ